MSFAVVALTAMSSVYTIPLDPDSSASSLSSSGVLFSKLGGKPTPFGCLEIEDHCLANTGTAANGKPRTYTTSSNGQYLFLKNNATVADCLVNLHYTQNTRCISVGGSPCQALVTTSRIQNSRSINPSGGAIGELTETAQLTAAQSSTMQAAVEALIGQKTSSSFADDPNDQGGQVSVASGNPGSEDAYVTINFYGEDPC